MRTSIIVALLAILVLLTANIAIASETDNTNTKIEFDINKQLDIFKSFLFAEKASAETLAENEITVQNTPAETVEEVKELPKDEKMEKVLARWQKKQAYLWNNLPKGKFTINASAYTAAADECGKSDGITSSGVKVEINRTIACPPNLPFGAKMNIEGMGTYICEDRGGAIKGNHIDIYMETKAEAFKFGRRNLIAEIVQ